MKLTSKTLVIFLTAMELASFPLTAMGATLKYAAWLPFWKKQEGMQDFALRMEKFSEISPFSYEVRADGSLIDSLKMTTGFWPGYLDAVKDMGIKIIPTIALLDGDQIHALLSNKARRIKHEDTIAALVKKQKYDGIDIDYEDKWAKTRVYFNTFLMGLSMRLHAQKKLLTCTVESRMSLADRFKNPPKTMEYANDYKAMGKYCDTIRIMAYDQGTVDLTLNAKKGLGSFYAPVADPAWVEKVIKETLKMVSPKKIMLGIPTYGYEYEVSWNDRVTTYKRLRANTFVSATKLAQLVGVMPFRNNAGELALVYPSSTPISVSKARTSIISSTTPPAGLFTSTSSVTRYATFSDAQSIMDKVALAKKYGLRGVVLFKMDGDIDPALWNLIK